MASVVPNATSSLTLIKVCNSLPPLVNSNGVWEYVKEKKHNPLDYSVPQLLLQMTLIFSVTQAIHFIFKRFGITNFSSQLMAGIVLGPAGAGRSEVYRKHVFPFKSQEALVTTGGLGYTLFLFLIGVKMDMSMVNKSGRKAMYTGAASLLAPLLMSLVMYKLFRNQWHLPEYEKKALVYAAGAYSVTQFPVISTLLNELNLINSELGRIALSSAIVSDLFSGFLTCTASVASIAFYSNNKAKAFIDLVSIIAYIVAVVFMLRPAMFWVVRQTPEGRPVKDLYIYIILLAVFCSGLFSHWFDQMVVFGPFIFGLAVPDGPPLGSALIEKLEPVVVGMILPLFVTTCAMRADLNVIEFDSQLMKASSIIIVIIIISKFTACLIPPVFSRMSTGDVFLLALIMSCKGIVEIASASFLRDSKSIPDALFAVLTLVLLATSIVIPILVKSLYDPSRKYAGYQKRNIMHLRRNTELRILACIQRPDNIAATINLLELACPSRETPISVYALHLIELIGRTTPVFISHQIQRKTISNRSYSENVIISFNQFERNNRGSVQVNAFTAISPPMYMDEDVCTLALNKLTSIIFLPFHRKWSIDGSVELEDNNVRALNCSVLERAPCSVCIIVDRGHLGRSTSIVASSESSCNVAMIFFGGADDREGLTFAKRMAADPNTSLSVIRFVAQNDQGVTDWEKMLDSEELKDVKENNVGEGYVIYVEEMVKDGPETALILRGMVDEYDLFIVGRRQGVETPQTAGLGEWSEFPELGTVGDLLASTDLDSRASVLVVQQQQQM